MFNQPSIQSQLSQLGSLQRILRIIKAVYLQARCPTESTMTGKLKLTQPDKLKPVNN